MRLPKACVEALDILCALNCLDAGLAELQIAFVCTVVQKVDVSVDFEALKLESL